MSFLAGRLAGKEGAYFFQESKQAIGRLAQKNTTQKKPPPLYPSSSSSDHQSQADILPEVLKHSLPSMIFKDHSSSSNSLSTSKWVLQSDPNNGFFVPPDALNPLRAYVSLPQVTFGPRRWELPHSENSLLASTANDLRTDKYTPINPEKLKAAAEGLANIGKAFAVATAFVFGGATLVFGLIVSKLELQSGDDIRTKGRDLIEPRTEIIKEQLVPLKIWAEGMSKKWHLESDKDMQEKPMIKELSKIFGARTSSS